MNGPYETEQEARELPAVQAVYAAFDRDPGQDRMAPYVHAMLIRACTAASVELGAFDRRALQWLAGFQPETAAVVCGLILRAREAGAAAPLADRMTALADWIDQRLDDENYDRQAVAESGVTQLRELAALARGGAS